MQTCSFIWLFKLIKLSCKDRTSHLSVPLYFLWTSGSLIYSENLVLDILASLKLTGAGDEDRKERVTTA